MPGSWSSEIVTLLRERLSMPSPEAVKQLIADSNALLELHDLASQIHYGSDDAEVIAAAQKMAAAVTARSVRRPQEVDEETPARVRQLREEERRSLERERNSKAKP